MKVSTYHNTGFYWSDVQNVSAMNTGTLLKIGIAGKQTDEVLPLHEILVRVLHSYVHFRTFYPKPT